MHELSRERKKWMPTIYTSINIIRMKADTAACLNMCGKYIEGAFIHLKKRSPSLYISISEDFYDNWKMRQKGTLVIHWIPFGGIMCSETYFFRSFLLMCVRCISCSFLYFRFVVSLWKYSHCEWLTVCYTEEMNPKHTHTQFNKKR